jgi:hypothetical protein
VAGSGVSDGQLDEWRLHSTLTSASMTALEGDMSNPISGLPGPRVVRAAAYLSVCTIIAVGLSICLGRTGAAAQNSGAPPSNLGVSDFMRILDARGKIDDLRRAVGIAENLSRQLGNFSKSLPTADSRRKDIDSLSADAKKAAAKAGKLEATKQSLIENAELFDWDFTDGEAVSEPAPFKVRLQRLLEQYAQSPLVVISDQSIISRFSQLSAELVSSFDQLQAETTRKMQFDQQAIDLQKKFVAAVEDLFGKETGSKVERGKAGDAFSAPDFTTPAAPKIAAFKTVIADAFSSFDGALKAMGADPDPYERVRSRILQGISSVVSEFRGELERATESATKTELGRQQLSTWLFVSLTVAFVVVIAMLLFIPRFYTADVQPLVFRSPFFLQLFTVYVLSSSIVILALGGFLESNSLATLLAGISGYVLGQLGKDGVKMQTHGDDGEHHGGAAQRTPRRRSTRRAR